MRLNHRLFVLTIAGLLLTPACHKAEDPKQETAQQSVEPTPPAHDIGEDAVPPNTIAQETQSLYDFTVKSWDGKDIALKDYEGKVVLIVNTATACGFTPQYDGLEALYQKYHEKGLEILDFPCNQFGAQAPGNDQEIHDFRVNEYKLTFSQFAKIDVNDENADPLYRYLVSQKGFAGFDPSSELTPILDGILSKQDPNYKETPDIKWNFTKFLFDRKGHLIDRYEPTTTPEDLDERIAQLLQ